jgi:hypothetical protein
MVPFVACNALFYSITLFSTYISSTQNIFKFIVEHKDSDYVVFQHQLESTDLINKMEIANALINEIVKKWTDNKEVDLSKDTTDGVLVNANSINMVGVPLPIKLSIQSLLTISNKINTTLDIIYCKINAHQQSYVKSFIKIKIADDIAKIVSMTALFEQRLNLMVNLLKIYY